MHPRAGKTSTILSSVVIKNWGDSETEEVIIVHIDTAFFFFVAVLAEEPEQGDDGATQNDQQHLCPLVVSFVELANDDLAAGDVNKSASRNAQENDIDNCVAFGDKNANDDSNGSNQSLNKEEEHDLSGSVASARESSSNRNS